jgi:hypothetical protein
MSGLGAVVFRRFISKHFARTASASRGDGRRQSADMCDLNLSLQAERRVTGLLRE